MCPDAEHSVFFDYFHTRDASLSTETPSRIEGIGRPRVEASFLPDVIDTMVKVPDRWSIAAMRELSTRLGRRVGPSTGTNFVGALVAAQHLADTGQHGSVVTVLCDGGERYVDTCYDEHWLTAQGLTCDAEQRALSAWMDSGTAPR